MLLAASLTLIGAWVARRVGLVPADSPPVVTLGVGLGLGLCVAVSLWASVASGGGSAFVPVALTYLLALGALLVRRRRRVADAIAHTPGHVRAWAPAVALAGLSIVAVALLYGATLAPRERDGVQPVEFMDEAFYSVLGRDLARTGVEWVYSPSGFATLEGAPAQVWYHWGELWLGAATMELFGSAALEARHFVALPLLLLAAAFLSGAFVQSFARTRGRAAVAFGSAACVVLAPVPWLIGAYHARWAVGLGFGITAYGLAAVAALLLLYWLVVLPGRTASWSRALFVGGTFALLLPAHVIVALLATLGAALGAAWLAAREWRRTRRIGVSGGVRRVALVAIVATLATLGWGLVTGHGLGGVGTSAGVEAFGEAWQQSILAVVVGGGVLLAPLAAAWVLRSEDPRRAALAGSSVAVVIAGAIVWGARLHDLNMFYVFFAGIAVFLTPIAAGSLWTLVLRARDTGRRALSLGLVALLMLQLLVGSVTTILRLQGFGPGDYEPVPVSVLAAIRALPPDARVAYPCQPMTEVTIWTPRLLAYDAHTGRRMVAMCFQADQMGRLVGAPDDPTVESPFFRMAPQREVYPTADARPTPEAITAFLRRHGIEYLYQDAVHADTLVPGAVVVHQDGGFRLLRLP